MTAPFPPLRALLAALVVVAAGCASLRDRPPPVPTPHWEPVDVDHTSSVRALARELGLAVRADPAVHSLALEGEYGRIVFLEGTREVLVAGRRVESGETIRIARDDLPLLTADAARIRRVWLEAVAEVDGRDSGPAASAPRAGRGGNRASVAAAADPDWSVPLTREWEGILIHHSATDSGNMEKFDKFHREVNHWLGVGYDFVIDNGDGAPDGLVETTFRWKQQIQGAHASVKRYNDHWVGICLVGDFNVTRPTARQLASLRRLVRFLQEHCGIPDSNIRFHRDVRDTDCPGRKFPVGEVLAESPRGK